MPSPAFGHLASAGISGAEKEYLQLWHGFLFSKFNWTAETRRPQRKTQRRKFKLKIQNS
jgi:hypothetical protein